MTMTFLSYLVPPSGTPGTWARTLPDQLADYVNVKDFGAIGNATTDDTIAIKAAFAAAWGPPGTPHGNAGRFSNKPVFFPAGDYKVTDTIYVKAVTGGWIIGQGSKTTRLIYAGSITNKVPATQTKCNLFFTNGFAYCRVEGLSFVMTGGNALSDNTCCFNWNWDGGPYYGGTSDINTTLNVFIDVGFDGGTYGCLMGDDQGATSHWGEECDGSIWLDCWINSCYYGTRSGQLNVMNSGWFGGSVRNCSQTGAIGMLFNIADFVIQGVDFSNNDLDIECDFTPIYIINCRSTSSWFCKLLGSGAVVQSCEHNSLTPTYFVGTVGNTQGICIDNCITNGALQGQGSFFIRETQFINLGWASGHIAEFTSTDSFTFAQLPPVANATEGLLVSIKDSPTATWGATVSGGSGSNHVLLNASGNTARGSITFSAQPADNSTITLGGTVITLHDGTGGAVDRGASLAASVDNLVTYINNNFQGPSGVNASASGTPHNKINLVANVYGSAMNSFGLVASTSPASNGTVSASTLLGGTGPIWTVVGK